MKSQNTDIKQQDKKAGTKSFSGAAAETENKLADKRFEFHGCIQPQNSEAFRPMDDNDSCDDYR
ncbi:MAG: hypothetical protein GY754_14600 [bacterium]|nr:hypothetical protein [bacterium]